MKPRLRGDTSRIPWACSSPLMRLVWAVHRLFLHIDAFEAAGRAREEELRRERELAAGSGKTASA